MGWLDSSLTSELLTGPAFRRASLLGGQQWVSLVALLVSLVLPTASHAASGCQSLAGLPINFNVQWQTDVKPIINDTLGGRCTGCHNAGQLDGGLDMTDQGSDAIYKIVPTYAEPGRPDLSFIFQKINCESPGAGTRMPASQPGTAGTPLTAEQQGIIYDWIAQGALGDLEGEPPIARDFIFKDGAESLRLY